MADSPSKNPHEVRHDAEAEAPTEGRSLALGEIVRLVESVRLFAPHLGGDDEDMLFRVADKMEALLGVAEAARELVRLKGIKERMERIEARDVQGVADAGLYAGLSAIYHNGKEAAWTNLRKQLEELEK
jgi:hypothetical protein